MIFLSYESRKLILESELSANPNPSDSCGCAPSDGSFPKASDPTCEFVRRQEVFKFCGKWFSMLLYQITIYIYIYIFFLYFTLNFQNFDHVSKCSRNCLDWIAFLTLGQHLPLSIWANLSSITSADGCLELITPFISKGVHDRPL